MLAPRCCCRHRDPAQLSTPAVPGGSQNLGFPMVAFFFFFPVSPVLAGSGTEPRGAGGAVQRAACPALAHPHLLLLHTFALPCMCSRTTLRAAARTCTLLHTLACPCTRVHALECFGMFLHVLAHICVLLRVCAHVCALLHALTSSGVLLHVLASTCLLLHALACPCSCVHTLACPCTLLCACLLLSQTPACAAEIRVQRKRPALPARDKGPPAMYGCFPPLQPRGSPLCSPVSLCIPTGSRFGGVTLGGCSGPGVPS